MESQITIDAKDYDDIVMIIKNEKTGVSEYISFTKVKYIY